MTHTNGDYISTGQESSHSKTPLLQDWMRTNSEMHPYINAQEWFRFVQFIIRSLKAYDSPTVDAYLDDHFGQLFSADLPAALATRGLTHLRSLMLRQVVVETDEGIDKSEKDSRILHLIAIFDRLFQRLSTHYDNGSAAEQQPGSMAMTSDTSPEKQRPMAFRTDAERFLGNTRIDQRFCKWLGIDQKRLIQTLDWSQLIHPEDYPRMQARVRAQMADKAPFYELVYRLKYRDGSWREMLEIGRVVYSAALAPVAVSGLVFETATLGETGATPLQPVDLLRLLMDSRNDLAFVINRNSTLVHATQKFLKYILADNAAADVKKPSQTFYELLDSENKVVALNFWEAIAAHPQNSVIDKKLLLKLKNTQSGEQVIVEFTPYSLDYVLGEPHHILWGKVIPGRRSLNETAERLAVLQDHQRIVWNITSVKQLYQQLIQSLQAIIPDIPAAALLLKTNHGYVFGAGCGFDESALQNKVLLDISRVKSHLNRNPDQAVETWLSDQFGPEILSTSTTSGRKLQRTVVCLSPGEDLPEAILVGDLAQLPSQNSDIDTYLFELLANVGTAALERIRSRRLLRETGENFQTLFDQSQLGMVMIQNERMVALNTRFGVLAGVTPESGPGSPLSAWIDPEGLPRFRTMLTHALDNSTVVQDSFYILGDNGSKTNCTIAFLPVTHKGAEAVICECLETGAFSRLEKQLRQRQKRESVGDLSGGMAHDFNNILAAIIPSAEMIMRQPGDIEANRRRAATISAMAKRAAAMTRKLTYYSLGETKTQQVNLVKLLDEARQLIEPMLGAGIQVHYDSDRSLPDIEADDHEVLQMLLNLVTNARDAMPAGGELFIKLQNKTLREKAGGRRTIRAGQYVCISVRDTGKGIPKAIQKQIFKPFFTTKADEMHSGLGLTIVRGILKKNEGYVLVQSSEAHGTTFLIYLPVHRSASGTDTAAAPPPVEAAQKAIIVSAAPDVRKRHRSGGRVIAEAPRNANPMTETSESPTRTILVIDDEPHLVDVYITMLGMMKHRVITAGSGKEGLRKYHAHRHEIDLVILDYGMPDISGKQVLRGLQKINPDVPVMLVTGYCDQREVVELIRKYQLHFLPKPFTMASLTDKVENVLKVTAEA